MYYAVSCEILWLVSFFSTLTLQVYNTFLIILSSLLLLTFFFASINFSRRELPLIENVSLCEVICLSGVSHGMCLTHTQFYLPTFLILLPKESDSSTFV